MNEKPKTPGKFFVISAPSGTGKTTIVQKILHEIPNCVRSVSATTRPPRPREQDGVDYRFINQDLFREMIAQSEFFEWEEVHGHLYGTPRTSLNPALSGGLDVILDIDTRGALSVKKNYPQSCLIFLKPPSREVLEKRLRSRKTEPEASLKRRLEAAVRELSEQDKFDHVIINDDLEKAYQEIKSVIEKARAGQ